LLSDPTSVLNELSRLDATPSSLVVSRRETEIIKDATLQLHKGVRLWRAADLLAGTFLNTAPNLPAEFAIPERKGDVVAAAAAAAGGGGEGEGGDDDDDGGGGGGQRRSPTGGGGERKEERKRGGNEQDDVNDVEEGQGWAAARAQQRRNAQRRRDEINMFASRVERTQQLVPLPAVRREVARAERGPEPELVVQQQFVQDEAAIEVELEVGAQEELRQNMRDLGAGGEDDD
jgi:hypothetical protein